MVSDIDCFLSVAQACSGIIGTFTIVSPFYLRTPHKLTSAASAPGDTPTRTHHLATYGPNVTYDDFLGNWTASKWNPDDWTDLFADSGAKYFVLVTKHHDGVVLFDTNSTDRNSVKLGPKRDFLKELFDSAKSRHPELHRGVRVYYLHKQPF